VKAGAPCARLKTLGELGRLGKLLRRQNRNVLRHGVAEDGTEDADIIAATIPRADDCPGAYLVSDTQARRPVNFIRNSAVVRNRSDPGNQNFACVQIREAGSCKYLGFLRVYHIRTQTVGNRPVLVLRARCLVRNRRCATDARPR